MIYADTVALLDIWKNEPALFRRLVDEIREDLEHSYTYCGNEFPTEAWREEPHQNKKRLDMVQEWVNGKSWSTTCAWKANKIQQIKILTMLFYSIWNRKFRSSSLAKGPSRAVSPQLLSTNLSLDVGSTRQTLMGKRKRQAPFKNPTEQSQVLSIKPVGQLRPGRILEHMLLKVMDLHSSRYASFLNSRNDWNTLLSQYVRQKVWDVCQKQEILVTE